MLCQIPTPSYTHIYTHTLLILCRRSHPRLNRRTKRRKRRTATRHRIRPRAPREDPPRDTSGGDGVGHVIFGAHAFDAALDAGVDRADPAEVARRRPRPRAHVLESQLELLPHREVLDRLCAGRAGDAAKGRVVGHLGVLDRGWDGREAVGRTEAMNMPITPPRPKPITPDMTVLPAQDSMAPLIWGGLGGIPGSRGRSLTISTLGSLPLEAPPGPYWDRSIVSSLRSSDGRSRSAVVLDGARRRRVVAGGRWEILCRGSPPA